MFKYFLILFFSFIGVAQLSYANESHEMLQNVTLKGKVTDESTGQALQGASVYFPELKKGVTSNEQGNYQIN
jgi:protocatechuate 3,4-dioxygenase beta subunit